jgi:hypothetical protein
MVSLLPVLILQEDHRLGKGTPEAQRVRGGERGMSEPGAVVDSAIALTIIFVPWWTLLIVARWILRWEDGE